MNADCVADNAGAIYTFEAEEMGQNRLINVQNVRLRPSHPPRPRKLAPWAATSWRMVWKAPVGRVRLFRRGVKGALKLALRAIRSANSGAFSENICPQAGDVFG